MKPLRDYVLVEKVKREVTEGGVILPESTQENTQEAKVISIGKLVKDVKVGDVVMMSKSKNLEVEQDGKTMQLITVGNILAVL